MHKKPFQYVYDVLAYYAKIQTSVQLTMIHLSYVLNCEDAPLTSKISDKEQNKLQESQETVDKVGAMERNEEKEEEKQATYADAIEDYLDSFESMQKATENLFGDTTIAEAMDDDLESLLMLSKIPAAVPASTKDKDIAKEKA